jgi:hypothetical protein
MVGLDLAAGFGCRLLDRLPRGPRLLGRVEAAEPAVGQAPGATQRGGRAATEPHIEPFRRARPDRNAVDLVELAFEVHVVVVQQEPEQGEGLVEHRGTRAGHREQVVFARIRRP